MSHDRRDFGFVGWRDDSLVTGDDLASFLKFVDEVAGLGAKGVGRVR